MKIGVMTGGGDCAGLNAAIRAVTRSSVIGHGFEVIGIENGFEGLINGQYRTLTPSDTRGILRIGGTVLGTSNRTNPFAYPDPQSGGIVDASRHAYEMCKELKLDALAVIGGDGTLTLSARFAAEYDVPLVGIPKTIDNDVHGTDFAIGFDTAVSTVTEAIDRLHTTAESHHRVMLVEVMGRTVGWITLYASIAGGADIALIPERNFTIEAILDMIDSRCRDGHNFTIGAVAEGVPSPGGELVYRTTEGEDYRWKLGGVCHALGTTLAENSDQEIRTIILGHLQRGGSPTSFDRTLATQLGTTAVEALADGQRTALVGIQGSAVRLSPLDVVTAGPRPVPTDHPLIQAALRMGMYIG